MVLETRGLEYIIDWDWLIHRPAIDKEKGGEICPII